MNIKNYDLIGSYNNQRITSIDAERSVNCFLYIDPLGKKPKSLIGTSGLDSADVDFGNTSGGFRASFFFSGSMYHVIGDTIWRIDLIGSFLVPTQINAAIPLTTTTGYVGVDANIFQIIFVDGMKGYIYDTTARTFSQITDSNFPSIPLDVCFLDGFFVVINGSTPDFYLSSLNQGMVWGGASNNFTTNFAVNNTNFIIGASTIGGPSGTTNYATGVPVLLTNSGGSLPTTTPTNIAAAAPGTLFYAVFVDATHIQIATSYANAIAGIVLTITNDGMPTNTIASPAQLQKGSITTHPGTLVACRTLHRRLFLFSQFYTEVWENLGIGTNLPFRRNNSLLMEYGTPAVGSISVGFDKMFFLSQDRDGLGAVMEVIGTESIPVSTKALDFQFAQYIATTGVSDCRSFLMRENGLIFYRMNFTSSNHTFVYNVSLSDPSNEATRLWHEEEVLNGSRHLAQTHVFFNGLNYVGDYLHPILYEVHSDIYTNDGENIRRMRIGKPVVPEGYQRMRINRFQVDFLQGQNQDVVLDNGTILTENGLNNLQAENGNDLETEQMIPMYQNLNPVAFLSISKDGGQSYGALLTGPMGDTGDRTFRTVYRHLGTTKRGQAFVPKIEFFDALPFVCLGAAWDFEVLPE